MKHRVSWLTEMGGKGTRIERKRARSAWNLSNAFGLVCSFWERERRMDARYSGTLVQLHACAHGKARPCAHPSYRPFRMLLLHSKVFFISLQKNHTRYAFRPASL